MFGRCQATTESGDLLVLLRLGWVQDHPQWNSPLSHPAPQPAFLVYPSGSIVELGLAALFFLFLFKADFLRHNLQAIKRTHCKHPIQLFVNGAAITII